MSLGLALMMPLMMMAGNPPADDMPEWGNWKTFTTKDGLPANKIFCVRADGDRVWIGTMQGLECYDLNTGLFHRFGVDVYDIRGYAASGNLLDQHRGAF